MKKVWARIGMSLIISDEEAEQLLDEAGRNNSGSNWEYIMNKDFARRFVKYGKVDGESYIPDDCISDIEKNDNMGS